MYEVLKTLKKYEQTEHFCILVASKLQQGTNGGPHLKSALRGNKCHRNQHLCKWKTAPTQLDAAA